MGASSRCWADQATPRSKNTTKCPPLTSARISARHNTAWPLPQEELTESPKTTSFIAGAIPPIAAADRLVRRWKTRQSRESCLARRAPPVCALWSARAPLRHSFRGGQRDAPPYVRRGHDGERSPPAASVRLRPSPGIGGRRRYRERREFPGPVRRSSPALASRR